MWGGEIVAQGGGINGGWQGQTKDAGKGRVGSKRPGWLQGWQGAKPAEVFWENLQKVSNAMTRRLHLALWPGENRPEVFSLSSLFGASIQDPLSCRVTPVLRRQTRHGPSASSPKVCISFTASPDIPSPPPRAANPGARTPDSHFSLNLPFVPPPLAHSQWITGPSPAPFTLRAIPCPSCLAPRGCLLHTLFLMFSCSLASSPVCPEGGTGERREGGRRWRVTATSSCLSLLHALAVPPL